MSAVAVAGLGKRVGQSLKGKLVVILWNQGRHRVSAHPVSPREILTSTLGLRRGESNDFIWN